MLEYEEVEIDCDCQCRDGNEPPYHAPASTRSVCEFGKDRCVTEEEITKVPLKLKMKYLSLILLDKRSS